MGDDIMVDSPLRNDVDPMTLSTPIQSTNISTPYLSQFEYGLLELTFISQNVCHVPVPVFLDNFIQSLLLDSAMDCYMIDECR